MGEIIWNLYNQFDFLADSGKLNRNEKALFRRTAAGTGEALETGMLKKLSGLLAKHYGKKVIILLDKYDTPMQEAYVGGYWKELTETVRDALRQIEAKDYQALLLAKGIPQERIRKYGFAFCGKKVLIGAGEGTASA